MWVKSELRFYYPRLAWPKRRILMIKKAIAIVLSLVVLAGVCFAGGTGEKGGAQSVADAIAAAENMTMEELEAAAKAEFEAAGMQFAARGSTSGVKHVLSGFKEKYPWFDYVEFSSSKDQALYTELTTAIGQNQYVADAVLIQDGSSLKSMLIDTGYMLNYVPNSVELADSDKDPLSVLYVNKCFFWNKTNPEYGPDYITNVWQLTGADGGSEKGVHQLSFQTPATENVNMNFLIMLTSEGACEKLAAAYESYFDVPYAGGDGYENIGYKFVTELMKNVTTWHSSDTTAVKNMATMTTGQVVYAPLNKIKDYPETNDYRNDLAITGWNVPLEGFTSYFYKMWLMIPKTARLPYTACLFVEFMCSEEGFTSGWDSEGYYSVNPEVPVLEGDHTLAEWLEGAVVEDIDYINSVYREASTYIRSLVI